MDFWFIMPSEIVMDFDKWLSDNNIQYELDNPELFKEVQCEVIDFGVNFNILFLIKILNNDDLIQVKLTWGEYGIEEPIIVNIDEEL